MSRSADANRTDDDDADFDPAGSGHDVHFLERSIDRLDMNSMDLALRLYRDPVLVRGVLADPTTPPGGVRVAVALAAAPSPPHVILERSGAFVTCLGAGMIVEDAAVVSFERLGVHLRQADRRAEEARLEREVAEGDLSHKLLVRLYHSGARLTIEDFAQLCAIEPVIHKEMIYEALRLWADLADSVATVAHIKPTGPALPLMRRLFHRAYIIGNLLLLISHRGRRGFEAFAQIAPTVDVDSLLRDLFLPMLNYGFGPLFLRACWSLGLAGKLAVPLLKSYLGEARNLWQWIGPAAALATIGRRHQRLRAEVTAALGPSRLPQSLQGHEAGELAVSSYRRILSPGPEDRPEAELCEKLNVPEKDRKVVAAYLRSGLVLSQLEERPAERFDDVMTDVWQITRMLNHPISLRETPLRRALVAQMVHSLADMPVGIFFYTAEQIALAPRFSVEGVRELLSAIGPDKPQPLRSEAKTGRNEPCPCGSGRKFKRCCGAK